jgi:hypothetical protein
MLTKKAIRKFKKLKGEPLSKAISDWHEGFNQFFEGEHKIEVAEQFLAQMGPDVKATIENEISKLYGIRASGRFRRKALLLLLFIHCHGVNQGASTGKPVNIKELETDALIKVITTREAKRDPERRAGDVYP